MSSRVTYINPPKQCDICQGEFGSTMYDARTSGGRWGNLCHKCFEEHGVGLGTGLGQMYQRIDDGPFVKEEG